MRFGEPRTRFQPVCETPRSPSKEGPEKKLSASEESCNVLLGAQVVHKEEARQPSLVLETYFDVGKPQTIVDHDKVRRM